MGLLAAAIYVAARTEVIPAAYNPLVPIDLKDPPNVMTGTKLWLMAGNPVACLAALRKSGSIFREMPLRTATQQPGCELENTVVISKLSRATLEPEEMRCDIALRLYLLERHDIQPLAKVYFGHEVNELLDFGSYACRNMRGSSRLSEHATANAYDLAGLRLATGRTIAVKQGWTGDSASRGFLRELRLRACLVFNMVLSPDYNIDHADHFHLDMGLWRGCN